MSADIPTPEVPDLLAALQKAVTAAKRERADTAGPERHPANCTFAGQTYDETNGRPSDCLCPPEGGWPARADAPPIDLPDDGEVVTPYVSVREMATNLRDYATHFVQKDWNYTRDLGHMKRIVWHDDPGLVARVGRALRRLAAVGRPDGLSRMMQGDAPGWRWRLAGAKVALHGDAHLPDGVLDGGGVLTYWEETGEYLQYVQPSVGALLADLMDAHPDLPEVRAIATEMKRIDDAYADRLRTEKDDDQ